MGREVRKVPADWVHPKDDQGHFIPLHPGDSYAPALRNFEAALAEGGLQHALDEYGEAPNKGDYMLVDAPEESLTHFMMYEYVTEGTPLSPAFATVEELARWLADNGASVFGSQTATYEEWLRICGGAWAGLTLGSGGARVQVLGGES